MAGRTTRPNGHTWITVKADNGKRRHVRLGQLSKDDADEAQRRLGKIEDAFHGGTPVDAISIAWLASLPPKKRDRVYATGLIPKPSAAMATSITPTGSTNVGRLVGEWRSTLDVAESTMANYEQTAALVVRYFGRERCVKSILPAEADKFVTWATREGRVKGESPMSRASISRGVRTVRRIFAFAQRLKWIEENPFAHVHSTGEVNEERWWYVTRRLVDKLIAECPDAELRTMVALSRYATFRGPSEFMQLVWTDIDWDDLTVKITAPKTVRYAGGLLRLCPLEGEAISQLRSLWELAATGDAAVFPRLGGKSSSDISGKLEAVCRRVGVPLWEKPWTNMRASCETDWQKSGKSIFETSEWMGHSPEVALRHYKRVANHIADLPAVLTSEALRLAEGNKSESKGETPKCSQAGGMIVGKSPKRRSKTL